MFPSGDVLCGVRSFPDPIPGRSSPDRHHICISGAVEMREKCEGEKGTLFGIGHGMKYFCMGHDERSRMSIYLGLGQSRTK
jgi:hypothetical protein